jgi:acetaldehyde dehydrogenase (acetylating)
VVGKSAAYVAEVAGFRVPAGTRILVAPLTKVGRDEPLSHEKMTTVLSWYTADGWEQGCEQSIAIIQAGGLGHTQIIHANDEKVIMAFGLEKPVFRILVNTMGTLGAIGLTSGVMPSLTLGPGGLGGAITGDNVTAYHLINIKRLAYETMPPPAEAFEPGESVAGPTPEDLEKVIRQVVNEILESKNS